MESTKESKDLVEKHFMAFPDIAADVINTLLYEGDAVVRAESLLPASTETLYSVGGDGTLRNQYEGKHLDPAPVVEMVLYWGQKHWNGARTLRHMFRRKKLSPKIWRHVDDIRLRVWEMRYLPPETRERFTSDMRIVLDYLAEGEGYRSDRPVAHKEALVKMLRVLDGDSDVTDTTEILREMNIREEDEITMCELFDQYIRKGHREGRAEGRREGREEGRAEGIMALISLCKELKVSFEETAARVGSSFHLEDAEVQENMRLYW